MYIAKKFQMKILEPVYGIVRCGIIKSNHHDMFKVYIFTHMNMYEHVNLFILSNNMHIQFIPYTRQYIVLE